MTKGVVQQVGQHLLHEELVDVDRREVQGNVDDHVLGAQQSAALHHIAHRGDLASQIEGAGLDAGHVQQVGHESLEGVGLFFDERQQLIAVLGTGFARVGGGW